MNTNKQRILIVALFFLVVASCGAYAVYDLPVRAEDQQEYMFDQAVERGALLYANNCRTCHGNQGEGFVGPTLNRADWRDQDPVVLAANKELLTRTLYCGRAGTVMPAWLDENGGALNERQIEWLVTFLTAPEEEDKYLDEAGNPTNKGWVEALEFAHNLNAELTGVVGGDSLPQLASSHHIGIRALAEANGLEPRASLEIPHGTEIQVPANADHPDGHTHEVKVDNETLGKLESKLFVGAAIIADLNGLEYEIDYDAGTFTLLENGEPVTGLLGGTVLELPEGAVYEVAAGDSLASIAERHGVSVDDIRDLNEESLADIGDEDELDGRNRLYLPDDGVEVLVVGGDTVDSIAEAFALTPDDIASENDIAVDQQLEEGQTLRIPGGARYTVGDGETLQDVAARLQVDPQVLVDLNGIPDPTNVGTQLVLELPKIDEYTVQAQTLDDLTGQFGNVTAAGLAEENGIEEGAPLRVGTVIHVPPTAYGGAAPDAINNGTGCVQYTIPSNVYDELVGDAFNPDVAPEEFTEELVVEANSNDWTFVADGNAQPANEGVVKVAPGTEVLFQNNVGIHTVTINGTKENDQDLGAGIEEFRFTFEDTGKYTITCDYHPAMLGYIFVEEQ